MLGRVVKADHRKRYGFIQGEDGYQYFVSFSDVRTPSGLLDEGYAVEFRAGFNGRGRAATNVGLVGMD